MLRTRDPKIERLAHLPLFSACRDDELRWIASVADEVEVPAGRVLAMQGSHARELLVLAEGRATMSIDGLEVGELTVGDRVGETELLTGQTALGSVVAATPCRVVAVEARRFEALVERVPTVSRQLLREHALRGLRSLHERAFAKVIPLRPDALQPA